MVGVVLAAGCGSRMGDHTRESPKCLVPVAGRPLLDRQIAALERAGAERVAVVGGWRADTLRGRGADVLDNPDWAETTMVGSLCRAAEWLAEDVALVSYGDIVFGPGDATRLGRCLGQLAVAYDRDWEELWRRRFADPLDDAETFAVDAHGRITDIGRRPRSLAEIGGQYVGLMRWTPAAWERFGGVLTGLQRTPEGRRVDMTAALRLLIERHGAAIEGVPVVEPWFEFDSSADLELGEPVARRVDHLLGAPV